MTEFLLVQHGGDFAADGAYRDGQFDPSIGPKGVTKAENLRDRLRDKHIDALYTSDFRRARETADIVVGDRDIPVVVTEDLREVHLGVLEDVHPKMHALVKEGKDPVIQELVRTRMWDSVPGCEGDDKFRARLRRVIDQIVKEWPDGVVMVATHGAAIQAIVAELLGVKQSIIFYPENCSLTVFRIGKDGNVSFLLVNSCMDRDLLYEYGAAFYSVTK